MPAVLTTAATSLRLQMALAVLAVGQVVHDLDGLRSDPAESFPGILLTPQAALGIGGALVALWLEARGDRRARPLAIVTASLVALGFVLVHGLPFAKGPIQPYWGDGSADVGQWSGLLVVLIAAAATIQLARAEPVTN